MHYNAVFRNLSTHPPASSPNNPLPICSLSPSMADFLFTPISQGFSEAIVPKNNLFRMRALCISLLAIHFACGFAFSASPHPNASGGKFSNPPPQSC